MDLFNTQTVINKPISLVPAHMIRLWRERPKIFLEDVLGISLDLWQEDVVELYRTHQRVGVVANKGPGKTFLQSALIHHFMMCHHQPKIACVSISADHLKSNLWAELLKMRAGNDLLKRSLTDGATQMNLIGADGWSFISARSFPKAADESQMASTLAGLHADNILFAFDEAGMIPDSIFATAGNALSGGQSATKAAKMLVMANPERPQGTLYRAYKGDSKEKWAIKTVTGDPEDPKRSPRVDIDWAREQIAAFGKDDPWVQVNIYGRYPATAADQLISQPEIEEAQRRDYDERAIKNGQMRLGVDVARGGVDRTAFARRRGLKAYPIELVGSDVFGPELAGKVALMQRDHKIERVFVDNTGGYGSSVIDSLGFMPNLDVTPVVYNAKAQDSRYFNKRTEMWVRMRDWIRKGGALPADPELTQELLMPKIYFHGGVFRLEEKEQIKKRLGRSPDRADALAQTFADVEQPSFFASYEAPLGGKKFDHYDDLVHEWHRAKAQAPSNYQSHETDIDNYLSTPSNYKS